MARQRTELQTILENVLGSRNVYFQPPENYRIKYPCIIYTLDSMDSKYADNTRYFDKKSYMVTVIDKDPDSTIPDKICDIPMCRFSRFYTSDNLNHYVFIIYF
jgi:hypothetical protein